MVSNSTSIEAEVRQRLNAMASRTLALLHRQPFTGGDMIKAAFGTGKPAGIDLYYPFMDKMPFQKFSDCPYFHPEDISLGGFYMRLTNTCYLPDLLFDPARKSNSFDLSYADSAQHEATHHLQSNLHSLVGKLPIFFSEADLSITNLSLTEKFCRAAIVTWHNMLHEKRHRIPEYFLKEDEVQARLHCLMIAGYAEWQKLPATRIELYAALHNLGLKMPDDILKTLHETPDGKTALKSFATGPVIKDLCYGKIHQLNRNNSYLQNPELQKKLWSHVYPFLYGHLIALYGDERGLARMGMDHHEIACRSILEPLFENPRSLHSHDLDGLIRSVPQASLSWLRERLDIYIKYNCDKDLKLGSLKDTTSMLDCFIFYATYRCPGQAGIDRAREILRRLPARNLDLKSSPAPAIN